MAFENLFIRTKKSIGGIELDAFLTESHENVVTLTKNPVEMGANITDHAIIEPKRIVIVAEVTDSPLGTAAFTQIIDNITGLFSSSQNKTRSNTAYNAILQLQELREPLQVQTKLKLYQNMIITNLSVSQDKDTSRMVSMRIAMEEVLITESKLVTLSENLLPGPVAEKAAPATDTGRKELLKPTDSVNKSVLKSVSDWLTK